MDLIRFINLSKIKATTKTGFFLPCKKILNFNWDGISFEVKINPRPRKY